MAILEKDVVKYVQYELKNASDLIVIDEKTNGWVFRGQTSSDWPLQTSLERAAIEHCISDLNHYEKFVLSKFKQYFHLYSSTNPVDITVVDWISMIQHYGGPTRLLDFSESLFIGAFFAIDLNPGEAVIWAVNLRPFISALLKKKKDKQIVQGEVMHGLILYDYGYVKTSECIENGKSEVGIYVTKPMWGNERLFQQQGVFLVQKEIEKHTFSQNLFADLSLEDGNPIEVDNLESWKSYDCDLMKIRIPDSIDLKFSTTRMLRSMNINDATLFPGIEGFSRSLKFISEYTEYSLLGQLETLEGLRETIHTNRFRID